MKKIVRTSLVLTIALMLMISVGACGRKNSNVPGEGSTYPQDYPTQ